MNRVMTLFVMAEGKSYRQYDQIWAGDLDEKVTLKIHSITHTKGQDVESFSTTYDLWAKVEEAGGSEAFQENRETGVQRLQFTIRYDSRFSPKQTDRIAYDGNDYDIVSVYRMRRNIGWKIKAELLDS